MDPKANLEEQRQLATAIARHTRINAASRRLAELVLALDAWRLSGGFDPYAAPQESTPREARRVCPGCKQLTTCIFDADPYQADVNGDETPVWLCGACRHERAQDI